MMHIPHKYLSLFPKQQISDSSKLKDVADSDFKICRKSLKVL